jgi:hypothetical protein
MNKKKLLYLILFIAFAFFSLNFFKSSRLKYMTKESGVLTKAEVYNRPECGRGSATADVIIAERIFTIDIGINDCIEGVYSIGDELEVLYCKKCGTAILPHSKANIRYWFSIVFFALPLYFLIILVSSFKRED